MKRWLSALLCAFLLLSCALPAFAADAEKTPVFDNVRAELTIAYAGKGSAETKYVVAIASIPNGDAVGYELYCGGTLIETFTEEPPYVTIASPSGEYKVIAFNRNDPAYRTESGPIRVETEEITLPVRLRWALKTVYLDVVVYGFAFLNDQLVTPLRQLLERLRLFF